MNKKEALKRLSSIEEETKQLRAIINSEKCYTLNDLTSYAQACKILGEKSKSSPSNSEIIKTIVKAANYLDNNNQIWRVDFTKSYYKYLPYFNNNGSGFGFYYAGYFNSSAYYSVGFYYKNSSTCELITKRFLKLYQEWLEE